MEEKLRFAFFFLKIIFVYLKSSRKTTKDYLVLVKFQQQMLESTTGNKSSPIPGQFVSVPVGLHMF